MIYGSIAKVVESQLRLVTAVLMAWIIYCMCVDLAEGQEVVEKLDEQQQGEFVPSDDLELTTQTDPPMFHARGSRGSTNGYHVVGSVDAQRTLYYLDRHRNLLLAIAAEDCEATVPEIADGDLKIQFFRATRSNLAIDLKIGGEVVSYVIPHQRNAAFVIFPDGSMLRVTLPPDDVGGLPYGGEAGVIPTLATKGRLCPAIERLLSGWCGKVDAGRVTADITD